MAALNNTQLEILKLFTVERSEEELLEIKKMLSNFLFNKAISLADEAHEEKGYNNEDMEKWAKEGHFRVLA